MELTGRELDEAVNIHVMGREFPNLIPHYSSNANACRGMEAEIERLGLQKKYAYEVHIEINNSIRDFNLDFWRLLTTPLAVRCRAAVKVCSQKQPD